MVSLAVVALTPARAAIDPTAGPRAPEPHLKALLGLTCVKSDRSAHEDDRQHASSAPAQGRPKTPESAVAPRLAPPVVCPSGVRIGCHTFRATGITAYLEAGGTLENAQAMAAHESPRTTKLYDRTGDEITLDEVERIAI